MPWFQVFDSVFHQDMDAWGEVVDMIVLLFILIILTSDPGEEEDLDL